MPYRQEVRQRTLTPSVASSNLARVVSLKGKERKETLKCQEKF